MSTLAPSYIPENDPIYPLTASFNKFFQQGTLKESTNTIRVVSESNNHNSSMSADGLSVTDDGTGGAKGNMTPLPLNYVPGRYDVLCGRGKKNYNSTGNQRLRHIVHSYVEQYSNASSRQDKSDILSTIVTEVRSASLDGGFIKQDPNNGRWFEVGDFLAREKVSQAFRDALHESYRSSKKYKHEKRRQRDKAAKIAKQKGVAVDTGKKESSKPKKKAPSQSAKTVMNPLQRSGPPAVLREDSMDPPAAFFPSREESGNMPPSPAVATSAPFDSPVNAMGSRQRTSWPHVTHNIFHPIHTSFAAQSMMSHQQQRRFSDATSMMMTPSNAGMMAHSQFHNSEPNINWSAHMDADYQDSAASLHSSFPTGMTVHPAAAAIQQHGFGGMAMANNHHMAAAMGLGGSMMPMVAVNEMMMNTAPFGQSQFARTAANTDNDEHRAAFQQCSNQRRSAGPLARSGSNVSTASATAIVARLQSSFTDLDHQDENPFEPVPLPAGNEDESHAEDQKDDESILLNW